jgi:hypothetical protein
LTNEREVNQQAAQAGRDMIAGDQTLVDQSVHHHHPAAAKTTVVEQLLARLQAEMETNAKVQAVIDELRRFHERKSRGGVVGLEAKLQKGNRPHEVDHALEKKELFAKVLEKWSMYASAQEIFAYLLARAELEYSTHVLPQLGNLNEVQINSIITTRIVDPVVEECAASVFRLNHDVAMGMFYWLAEQCFVRWHK